MILLAPPESYAHALVLRSNRLLVRFPERSIVPRVCETWDELEAWVRQWGPLPCLVVIEDSMAMDPVRHVLVTGA